MNHCENCGLPEWAVTGVGLPVKITVKAENRFKRDSTKTVWACSEECTYQTLAISKYGINSSKWPVTLSQFRTMNRAAVTEMSRQVKDSKDTSECFDSETVQEGGLGVFVTKKGRPKKDKALSGAERIRAYRARKRA